MDKLAQTKQMKEKKKQFIKCCRKTPISIRNRRKKLWQRQDKTCTSNVIGFDIVRRRFSDDYHFGLVDPPQRPVCSWMGNSFSTIQQSQNQSQNTQNLVLSRFPGDNQVRGMHKGRCGAEKNGLAVDWTCSWAAGMDSWASGLDYEEWSHFRGSGFDRAVFVLVGVPLVKISTDLPKSIFSNLFLLYSCMHIHPRSPLPVRLLKEYTHTNLGCLRLDLASEPLFLLLTLDVEVSSHIRADFKPHRVSHYRTNLTKVSH
ncbi:hypothetical protein LXL04_034767 [Taraxacum kok-saghyz]